LLALPVQYADFAAWQRDWLGRGAVEEQLAYWQERLGGGVPALDLPADRRRPATRSDRGAVVPVTVPRETTEALKALGGAEGATLFMVLLAAFQTLLWRYTGQSDLVVGTPVAGRTRPEIEGLIGCFVNTLALRTDVSGDPTFRALVARVKEVTLGAYAHQEAPFEWLVERLQPERDPSRTPLFQAMVVLQNTPREELQLRGVRLTPLEVHPETSKFDVTWQVREEAGGLAGTLEYSTDLFDAARMGRMAGHLETLLAGAAAQPDARLSELPVLTAVEQAQLIAWNATEAPYDAERCLHELVEAQAARTPDAPALMCGESMWSYGELNRRANRLARRLRMLGVRPGDRVGLTVERTPETIMALLGILQAGAAYVPMDMTYPPERLAWMVQDAGLRIVVTRNAASSELGGMPVILVDPMRRAKGDADAAGTAGLRASARDAAYVIYTSGSTGKPKGVEIEHKSVVNLVTALEHAIYRHHRGQPLRVGVNAPLTFDGSVKQVVTLALGHMLVLVPEEVRLDPEALLAYLEAQRVDVVDMTPGQLKTVLATANGRPIVREALLVGGEAIDEELWQQLAAGPPVFYNVYGPTECTVDTAIHRIGPGSRVGVVGGPVANLQAYVVGAGEALLPVGVPGELVVGGAGVGRGYMGRADLTAERFVPDVFSGEAGGRLYRTGDLVRWTDRGDLEFLGRTDHQVKVRGFRIEPGEIEAVLSGHLGVTDNAVIVREDTPGEKRLVAYVVARQGHTVSSAELRAYLKTQLPDYMAPSAFVFLETLPLTPHGKVNRAVLPAPDVSAAITTIDVPPTPLEQALASIWAEVLRRESIGIHDNFFDLGGHSLLAPRLFSMIEQRLGRRLPLGVLYRSPTVGAMARAFSLEASRSSVLVPFAPVGDGPKFFCVHPGGGAAMVYKALADHLRPAVRLYGLQAPGVMDAEQPLRSIEAMARRYVLELRAEQPHGPYHVGGYSLGGIVAFEIATILMREGEQVATLALIDCAPPGGVPLGALDPRVVTLFARVIGVSMREDDVPEFQYAETVRYVARRVARETVAFGTEEEIAALLHRLLRLADVMRQAGQRYQPRPYPGALVFLKASEGAGETADHCNRDGAYGWASLVEGPLTVADVPGTHETIVLEPNVRELARTLSHYILS
jgi:amino acid adenylation domain-containing protein